MTESNPFELLAGAIKEERPIVLFAGQGFDPAHEAVLCAFRAHLKCSDSGHGWRSTLDGTIAPSDMQWLSERFDRCVPCEAIAPLFEVAWSAVFTSCLDPQFLRRFESRGRQPEAVLSQDARPTVPRSRSRPPVHYLLGKSDETAEDVRPPRNSVELVRRVQLQAAMLANRIAETATPLGVVLIAGYVPTEDWLPQETLLAPLSGPGQPNVIWFGHSGEIDSPLVEDMVSKGSLLTVKTSLASAAKELEIRGVLDAEASVRPDDPGMVSLENGQSLDIGPTLRMRVEASAAIIDDGWTESPEPLTDTESYEAFRRFHGNLGGFRHLVEGVARGFAVERDFEQILWDTVKAKLKQLGKADAEDVVFLHGQSGTGKTIALARLTLRIRKVLRLPVVVAQYRIPHYADIEAFCQESERSGAPATVLICSFNQSPQRYEGLAAALRSRGRRLLIVGACYREESHDEEGHRFVAAPSVVSKTERSAIEELPFDALPIGGWDERPTAQNVFAMFYRRLPAAREGLAAGVSSEARVAEDRLRQRARNVPRSSPRLSTIAQQLVDLGIASLHRRLFDAHERLAALHTEEAGRLVDYVMVAGRLDCPIPVNLVFRALDQEGGITFSEIVHLFEDLDLFRWEKNEEGSDYLISPRLQLEADLICRRRLSASQEVERLLELIVRVRLGSGSRFELEGRAERSFLIDLLFKVDRDGPRTDAYREGWASFADALKGLRQASDSLDPDLVLRECVFRRRAAAELRRSGSTGAKQERMAMLDEARQAVDGALEQVAYQHLFISQRTKRRLFGERSAIYGYLAVECALDKSGAAYWSDYLAARAAGEKAIGFGGDYHPIDIALWTAGDVLKARKEELSVEQRGELLADLYETIDTADDALHVSRRSEVVSGNTHDASFPEEGTTAAQQRSRYLTRRSKVAAIMGDVDLEAEALAELERVAPEAATFLEARRRAESFYGAERPLGPHVCDAAGDAADYITARAEAGVPLDDRCRRLFLRLRWAHATGERLLFAQRGRTPVRRDAVRELRNVVSDLNAQAELHARNGERFLEAVLCWLLDDRNHAHQIWRSLSRETEFEDRSRVIRWLIASREDGSPQKFRGRVERKGESDWRVRVEDFDTLIAIQARDFPSEDLAHGRTLRGFGIAFNYIGPIADPLSRSVRSR